jgi:hypothetical protein
MNQTRPHCVNQMGKTHSKPLAARHGRGTAWARHAMCQSALILQCLVLASTAFTDIHRDTVGDILSSVFRKLRLLFQISVRAVV